MADVDDIKADLYLTYKYLVSSNYNNDVPAPHIREMSRYLMALWTGELDKHLAISVPPRHPVSDDVKVKTADGIKLHGDLTLDDKVYNHRHELVGISGITPPVKCEYKVYFNDGQSVICSDTHLWSIKDWKTFRPIIKNTKEIFNEISEYNLFELYFSSSFDKSIVKVEKVQDYTYGRCIELDSLKSHYEIEDGIITENSKSSLVTLAYVAWLIMQDPTLRIMIITNSGTLSERFGLRLRDIFRRNREFIGVDLSEAKQAKTDFYFAYPEGYKDPETGQDLSGEMTDGHVFITSKGGSVTGHDVDVLIIDDPYNGTDDLTPSALQKTINWFNEIVSQRIEPHTKFLILHTRWNAYDLIGYFEKTIPDDFIFLKYPAIDDNGNVLWPERYKLSDFEKQQKIMGDAMFQAIYQQKPLDLSTDFFNMDKIHWVNENRNGHPLAGGRANVTMKCRSWDISSKTGKENDFTAGVPVYRLNTGDILITDFIYGKFGETSDDKTGKLGTTDIIKRATVHDGVGMIQCIELPGTSGDLLFTEYRKLMPGYRLHHSNHKNMPKEDRATPFRDKVEAGKVYVDIRDAKLREIFMKELSGFPNGMHDDIVDAISHAINYLFNYFNQRKKGDQVAFFV